MPSQVTRREVAARANQVSTLSKRRGAPLLKETSSRETLIQWLQWNDPNGQYSDADLAAARRDDAEYVDADPLSLKDAWELVAEQAYDNPLENPVRKRFVPSDVATRPGTARGTWIVTLRGTIVGVYTSPEEARDVAAEIAAELAEGERENPLPLSTIELSLLLGGVGVVAAAITYLLLRRPSSAPQLPSSPGVLQTGLFDAGGNVVQGGQYSWWADLTTLPTLATGATAYATAVDSSGAHGTVQGVVLSGTPGGMYQIRVSATGVGAPSTINVGDTVTVPSSALHAG